MNRTITYLIEDPFLTGGRAAAAGEFLRRRGYSRHLLTYLRHHSGTLLLNGSPAFTNHILAPGDVLTVSFTDEPACETIIPCPIPLDIVYEDEDLLVVSKPPFLPIQPSLGHPEHTLGNAVVSYYDRQGLPFIYRCVNRLDRNTSGLVVIAKNMVSSAILYEQMKTRSIRRTYFCAVHGKIEEDGTIDAPIGRRAAPSVERFVDFECGQRAVTHYHPLCYRPETDITALEIRLETGRTHQIRVHMAYAGHPVAGDSFYGADPDPLLPRQALHSAKLDFMHPVTQKQLHFEAPVPEDILSLFPGGIQNPDCFSG